MAERQATCTECGAQFTFPVGRGLARTLCSKACREASAARRRAITRRTYPRCSVDGCTSKVRSGRAIYCEKHYYRARRNGTLALMSETDPPPEIIVHTHGYLLEYAPGHWLAERLGTNRVYQHRRVFFDKNGEGPFECHWCGVTVSWDDMHVDHLNAKRDDNRHSNLVASCPPCNVKRGVGAMTSTMREKSKARITWRGECLTLGEWAARIGISRQSLQSRINSGWPLDRALTEPRGKTGPISKAR